MNLLTKKLNKSAILPTRANKDDAGIDFYALDTIGYGPNDLVVIPTGIAINVPKGFVGIIRDRSSFSKTKLKVTAGIIDAGYTGEIQVVMLNLSGEHGHIKKGQKFAQMLIVPIATPSIVEVDQFSLTDRGEKGFGSSGN